MSEEEYMTPSQVAHLLKVDANTVRSWERTGRLIPALRIGNMRMRLYKRIDVENLITKNKHP